MAPYYQLDDDGKRGRLYLIPDDVFRIGFQVGWSGSEYILYQSLDPFDLMETEEDFLDVGDEIPNVYVREVGRTSDMEKMENCLKILSDRYTDDIVFTIPLSLEVSTEASNVQHVGRKFFFSDGKRRPLNEQEKKALESAKNYMRKF